MMRIPHRLLLPLVFLAALCLAACGQSGDLYRPDENATSQPADPEPTRDATDPAVADAEQDKKKDEEDKAQPAAAPSPDSTRAPTSQPQPTTP